MLKKIFSEVLIITLISVSLSLAVNGIRSQGIPFFPDSEADEEEGFKEISVEGAIQKVKQGKVLFADARPSDHYEAEHIKGASNLPFHTFDEWIEDFLSKTEPDTEIISYCDGEHCSLGRDLAQEFHLVGFENVFYMKNGLSRWREKSQPTEGRGAGGEG